MKKINAIGHKYGKLTILSEHSKSRSGATRYNCQCECGNTTNVLLTHLRQGNTISCGCAILKGKEHYSWTGCGEISGKFWNHHILRSANGEKNRRKIELDITIEFIWELFLKQNRKCKLSGLELSFPKKFNDKSWTASLDRIDSSKGYTKDNVQWLHKDINMMKRIYNQDYFIKICKLIAENN